MKRYILLISILLLSVGWIIRAPNRSNYVDMPGTSGNYLSMPDSSANSPSGDFTLTWSGFIDDMDGTNPDPLISKRNGSGAGTHTFHWNMQNGSAAMNFLLSNDGDGWTGQWSSSTIPVGDGVRVWLKVEVDVDNGASGSDVSFFYKTAAGDSWTDISSTGSDDSVGVADAAVPVYLAYYQPVSAYGAGGAHEAAIYNGLGDTGTPAIKFDANRMKAGQTSYTDTYSGGTWTINQSGSPQAEIVESP